MKFNFDSAILDASLQSHLVKLCEFPKGTKWELKYRATRDGFKGEKFHSKCDGLKNTLSVIKTTSGNVFGGFAEQPWHLRMDVTDPNSFLFSLINEDGNPFKAVCSNGGKRALHCYSTWGPSFGDSKANRDICIKSDSNTNYESYSDFGHEYTHREYPFGSVKAATILAGSCYFQTAEIEVFARLEQLTPQPLND